MIAKEKQFLVNSIFPSKVDQTPILPSKSHGQGITMVIVLQGAMCTSPLPPHLTVQIWHQHWTPTTETQNPKVFARGGKSRQQRQRKGYGAPWC